MSYRIPKSLVLMISDDPRELIKIVFREIADKAHISR